ncbi:MAG: response regulator transcription factor [Zoogloea sp.]|uniref:response regulator transcription factor n=1 Tax=Zoogloea sp. TaxID=49181 RepID=UPI003F34A4EC|nr:response regulator [Azovibrio sp.]
MNPIPQSPPGDQALLFIEDDENFARIMGRALRSHGFAVQLAHNGLDARTLAEDYRPGHVLLDLNLEGHSGLRLIEPLLAANAQARIVVLTGHASIATAVQAIKLGASEYLTKPVNLPTILAALQGTPHQAPPPVQEWMTVDSVEWEYIQRVLADNGGNISATARSLRMHRRTLQRKLAKKRPD